MKKYLNSLILAPLAFFFAPTQANGQISILADITGDKKIEHIEIKKFDAYFHELIISAHGKTILKNSKLIPTHQNMTGREIFQGIAVSNGNLVIYYHFCEPPKLVCTDKKIITRFIDGRFEYTLEDTFVFDGDNAVRALFFNTPSLPLSKLTYQHILQDNGRSKRKFFSKYPDED